MIWNGEFETDRISSEYFPEGFVGGCVDVGAADGVQLSNTLAFEQMGWLCLCIEANKEHEEALKKNRKHYQMCAAGDQAGKADLQIYGRPDDLNFHLSLTGIKPHESIKPVMTLVGVSEVTVKTLNQCIYDFDQFKTIDFVSIDTEGNELDVLKGFAITFWKPRLMVVENIFGDPLTRDYMTSQGYKLDKKLEQNEFFVPV